MKGHGHLHVSLTAVSFVQHAFMDNRQTILVYLHKQKSSNGVAVRLTRVPGGWGSQNSRQSAHEGGKVVGPTHCPGYTLALISFTGWFGPRNTVPPELRHWKIQWHHRESSPWPSGASTSAPRLAPVIYRVIHKSLRNFRTRLRNQDRHGRKEHINRQRISQSFFLY